MDAREQERIREQQFFEQQVKESAEVYATFCSEFFNALRRHGFQREEAMDLVAIRYEAMSNCEDFPDYD